MTTLEIIIRGIAIATCASLAGAELFISNNPHAAAWAAACGLIIFAEGVNRLISNDR